MLLLKKRQNYYELALLPFVLGIKKVKFVLLELHQEQEDMIIKIYRLLIIAILLIWKNLKKSGKKFVIAEYLPSSKWMTLTDKRIFLKNDSLITSWFQILVQDLIGKEKDLKPFWNNQCMVISKKLWLPTEIDYADLHSNSCNGFLKDQELNSWFSTSLKTNPIQKNSQMTSCPLSISTPVVKWEKEDIRARKIRLYPNLNQQKILKNWIHTRRYVYNKSLEQVKKYRQNINFYELRNKLVTYKHKDNTINTEIKKWELETPKDIRASAIRDMVKNYKTAFSLLKSKQINNFNMSYCSKRSCPSIELPKSCLKIEKNKNSTNLYIYKTFLKEPIKYRGVRNFNFEINYDCRLQYKYNKWFLIVPYKKESEEINNRKSWCSLDPGVRTFQTLYSEDMTLKINIKKDLIKKLQVKLDKFRSLRDKNIIKKSRFKRTEKRIFYRLNNLIDDLHHKTSNYLSKTFNHIILPRFESQEMSKKMKIKSVNRNLLQLKHYLFQTRLKSKCALRKCYLDICSEEYTSQTCGVCGCLTKVGGKEVFNCSKCGLVIDRDYNGARNIAIKRILETS